MAAEKPKDKETSSFLAAMGTNGRSPMDELGNGQSLLDAPLPRTEVTAVDIPELKKKEKEKRRGGVPWGPGGQGAGSSLAGQGGLLGSGRLAAFLADLVGGEGTTLGNFLLSKLGSFLVLLGMLGAAAVAGLVAFAFFAPRPNGAMATGPLPMLDGIATSLHIKTPRNRSLDYAAKANSGEIKFGQDTPNALKPEAPSEQKPEPPAPPTVDQAVADAKKQSGLEAGRSSFIRKMTSDTSQLMSGGGGAGLKQGAGGFNLRKTSGNFVPKLDPRGKLAKLDSRSKLVSSGMTRGRIRTSRALGQLRASNFYSRRGAQNRDEASSNDATQAFEQNTSQGGTIAALNGLPVVPVGEGGPPMPSVPNVGPTQNVTPYQPLLDSGMNLGSMAGMLRMMGLMMMAAGAALIAAGIKIMHASFPGAHFIGIALIIAGAMLVMIGMMMMMMAQSLAGMAGNMGGVIGGAYGQEQQGDIVTERAKAKADGVNYDPSAHDQNINNNYANSHDGIQNAINNEYDNSGYTEDGGPTK